MEARRNGEGLECDLNISHYSIGAALKCQRLGQLEGFQTLFMSSEQTATQFIATSHPNALVTFKCDKLSAQTAMKYDKFYKDIEHSSGNRQKSLRCLLFNVSFYFRHSGA